MSIRRAFFSGNGGALGEHYYFLSWKGRELGEHFFLGGVEH